MWKWILLGAFVLWYMQRPRQVPVSNRPMPAGTGSGIGDAAGRAATGIINEAGPAIGKWISGLFSGGSSAPSSSSQTWVDDSYEWGSNADYV